MLKRLNECIQDINDAKKIAIKNSKTDDDNYFKGVIVGLEMALEILEPFSKYVKLKQSLKSKNNYLDNLKPRDKQISDED